MTLPDEATLLDALRQVLDPEAGVNIVDLGLVYGLQIGEGGVKAIVTMTSPTCPMADMIGDDVQAALEAAVPRGVSVSVELVWDPPWTPERMSGLALEHFGWARR